MAYTLNINIDKAGIDFLLDNKQTIVLVLPSDSSDIFLTACASFNPFGTTNEVIFEDEWILYATQGTINSWDKIIMDITQSVAKGKYYKFDNHGFDGSSPAYSKEIYGLLNSRDIDNENLVCGLGQKIIVSNTLQQCPISIRSIPYNQLTYFYTNSLVWVFVASGISSASIIPASALLSNSASFAKSKAPITIGRYLEVDLTINSSIRFNNTTNVFELDDK